MQPGLLLKAGITALLCLCVSVAHAQWEPAIFLSAGYAGYSAKEMKEQNKDVQQIYPKMKIVSNYPAYLTWSGGISVMIDKRYLITVFGGHSSTGSRVSYGDYSGHIYQDNLVRTSTLGASAAISVWEKNGFSLFSGLKSTLNLHTLRVISEVQTGSDYSHNAHSFETTTIGFEPHINLMKTIKRFVFRVEAGYEIQLKGRWHLPGDKNAYLVNATTNEDLHYNASGFRLNAGFSFLLNPNKVDQ